MRKAFGEKLLMDDVNFSIPAGAIVGVVGPNGAGKSTLINMIMGKDKPDSGEVLVGETVKLALVGQDRYAFRVRLFPISLTSCRGVSRTRLD